jgi:hypothetical protein
MRKRTPNEILRDNGKRKIQRTHKNLHRRVKEEKKVGYAVVTDQQLTQRRIRSHHRRNIETTDNGNQRSDIY